MSAFTLSMEETFTVRRSAAEAFRYIVDFSTLSEWDPNITASSKRSAGSVGMGTIFDVKLKLGLKSVHMEYEVTEFELNKYAVLKGEAKELTAIDTVTVDENDDGSIAVTWRADITFRGLFARIVPLVEKSVRSNGIATIQHLKVALQDNFPVPKPKRLNIIADKLILPGLFKFTRFGYRWAQKAWSPVSADISDKHVVITGATSGLGLAAANMLAARGASLTLVARDEEKANVVRESIINSSGNDRIAVELADLSLVSDTKALCSRLLEKNEVIDVLVNNAGALFNERIITQEGLEKSFSLLLLSPCILTETLLPLLQRSGDGRVINVSSGGMYTQRLEVDDLQSSQGRYDGSLAYARAKRGLVVMTEEWADTYKGTGVTFNAMHPGWADTPGVSSALPGFYKVSKGFLRTPEEGMDTIFWLAVATEAGTVSGKFFLDREIHTTHILPRTSEGQEDRVKLKAELKRYAKADSVVESQHLS